MNVVAWTDAHAEDVMRECLWNKYSKQGCYQNLLLETGEAPLHELTLRGKPNRWTKNGGDLMGKMLMETRDRLKRKRGRPDGCPTGDWS